MRTKRSCALPCAARAPWHPEGRLLRVQPSRSRSPSLVERCAMRGGDPLGPKRLPTCPDVSIAARAAMTTYPWGQPYAGAGGRRLGSGGGPAPSVMNRQGGSSYLRETIRMARVRNHPGGPVGRYSPRTGRISSSVPGLTIVARKRSRHAVGVEMVRSDTEAFHPRTGVARVAPHLDAARPSLRMAVLSRRRRRSVLSR